MAHDRVVPLVKMKSPKFDRIPSRFGPRASFFALQLRSPARAGLGVALSGLCMTWATTVAICTYCLNSIANSPISFGVVEHGFDSFQWNVPIHTLLRGSSFFSTNNSDLRKDTPSLSYLLYHSCDIGNSSCGSAFLDATYRVWSYIGLYFQQIPELNQTWFNYSDIIHFDHINNLSGWNKPLAQFFVKNNNIAVTCMIRRAQYSFVEQEDKSAQINSLAFCSQQEFDPNWICESDVPMDTKTYIVQMDKGDPVYLGFVLRRDIYLNAGQSAAATGGLLGNMTISAVPSLDEYQGGVVQDTVLWDIVASNNCSTLDVSTNQGWLMKMQGKITVLWQCSSLMLTNAVILWITTLYLGMLQFIYLRESQVCIIPVVLSKSIAGVAVLVMTFYGNANLQALTTFLVQNSANSTLAKGYALCGPLQLASIVGITTAKTIQLWFTPRIVTQTWILIVFSVINWILVFSLEWFVFPFQSINIPKTCTLPTSTNCFFFTAIPKTHYLSPLLSGGVVVLAIITIYIHGWWWPDDIVIPETNSMLQYLKITNIRQIATSAWGCVVLSTDNIPIVDSGILLMKNTMRISDSYLTRTSNVHYGLLYHLIPSCLKRFVANDFRTIRVIHIRVGRITSQSSYVPLQKIYVDDSATTWDNWAPGLW